MDKITEEQKENKSPIKAVKKDKGYFVASNKPFNDKSLSWEARGVLPYLLSKPDDWTVRNGDLYKQGPAGINKVKRMLRELKDAGYLERTRVKKPDGTFEWESTVHETPLTIAPKTTDGKQCYIPSTESSNGRTKKTKKANYRLPPLPPREKTSRSGSKKYHEWIHAVWSASGCKPPEAIHAEIMELFSRNGFDDNKLRQVFKLWTAKGFSPKNFDGWLFEWYPNDAYYETNKAVLNYSNSLSRKEEEEPLAEPAYF